MVYVVHVVDKGATGSWPGRGRGPVQKYFLLGEGVRESLWARARVVVCRIICVGAREFASEGCVCRMVCRGGRVSFPVRGSGGQFVFYVGSHFLFC